MHEVRNLLSCISVKWMVFHYPASARCRLFHQLDNSSMVCGREVSEVMISFRWQLNVFIWDTIESMLEGIHLILDGSVQTKIFYLLVIICRDNPLSLSLLSLCHTRTHTHTHAHTLTCSCTHSQALLSLSPSLSLFLSLSLTHTHTLHTSHTLSLILSNKHSGGDGTF